VGARGRSGSAQANMKQLNSLWLGGFTSPNGTAAARPGWLPAAIRTPVGTARRAPHDVKPGAGPRGAAREQRVPAVPQLAQPPVHGLGRPHDARAVRGRERLVAEAHAQDGRAGQLPQHVHAHACGAAPRAVARGAELGCGHGAGGGHPADAAPQAAARCSTRHHRGPRGAAARTPPRSRKRPPPPRPSHARGRRPAPRRAPTSAGTCGEPGPGDSTTLSTTPSRISCLTPWMSIRSLWYTMGSSAGATGRGCAGAATSQRRRVVPGLPAALHPHGSSPPNTSAHI
jgi:hypothetical protein